MKKSRVGKRKMHSYEKKIILPCLAILFVFSFLAIFVSFNNSPTVTGHDVVNIFNLGEEGSVSTEGAGSGSGLISTENNLIVARYLLFLMLTMVIYWILGSLVNAIGTFPKLLFSAIVGYLSVAFISLQEIYSLMITYSALGATLSVFVPFALIIMFSSKLVTEGILSVGKVIVQRGVWIIYGVFLAYYAFATMSFDRGVLGASPVLNILIILIFVFTAFAIVFNKQTVKWMRKMKKNVDEANTKARIREAKLAQTESSNKEAASDVVTDLRNKERLKKKTQRDMDKLSEGNVGDGYD